MALACSPHLTAKPRPLPGASQGHFGRLARCALAAVLQFEITRDVVENACGLGNVRVTRNARRFESHALEPTHRVVDGQAVLQRDREASAETLNEAREGRTFLAHFDEDLAWAPILKLPHRQVALESGNSKLVGGGLPRAGENLSMVLF
jgi:hypothetical protein